MGACTKIWAATAVLMLTVSFVLGRPSDPEATDEQRESRTSNGFKLSSGISSQRYDDGWANAERVIPVHILLSDDNQHKPVAEFETLRQGEEPNADDSGIKATQHFAVTNHEQESSVLPNAHNKSGDFNAGIRDEHVQDALSSTGELDSKPTEGRNEYKHVELTHGAHQSISEGESKNNGAKFYQHFSKSQNRDITKKTIGESHEKMTPPNPEINAPNEDISAKQETLVKDGSIGKTKTSSDSETGIFETGVPSSRTFLPSNPRQLPHPFENPILTYLNKKQSPDSDSSEALSKQNEANTSQNIRREVFHQQTFINPNPNIYPFLQQQLRTQQANPAYYQRQHPVAQQQLNSLPNTHFYTHPAQAEFPGNIPYTDGYLQGQGIQNSLDSIHDEVPQFPSNFKKTDNLVSTLTVYPAIASVMYTTPTSGFTSTSSAPLPSNSYQSQANLPYTQSYLHNPFRGAPSPGNLPKTRLIYNGPQQYSSRIPWPLANYFPIVIKDPFLSMYNMITSMIEYGPEADVCRKTKSFRQGRNRLIISGEDQSVTKSEEEVAGKVPILENRDWKEMSKNGIPLPTERKTPEDVTKEDEAARDKEKDRDEKRSKKDEDENTEVIMETGGSGNAGPYITRLTVKKGGVSIAGPGGIATAGSGGTAIVGPGGVAYTSPNGLAVVGPGGKVVGLPSGADLSVLTSKLTTSTSESDGSTPRLLHIPPGGKVVATGPVVYFHPPE